MRLTAVAACATTMLLATSGCGGSASRLSITVSPASATFDTPFTVELRGLPTDAAATVEFSGHTSAGRTARYHLTVRADARGRASLEDFYLYPHLDPEAGWPTAVRITATSGRERVSTRAERTFRINSMVVTSRERPGDVGFYGEWIRPLRAHHHTAVLLFGGSEGGLSYGFLAKLLAAHGYPVLELAYFSEPGLPTALSSIPLEYFERALRWLAKRPAVDPGRIVTFGGSRGGEASLLIASTFPRLVHAAVGYAPASTVHPSPDTTVVPAWTYRGKAVPIGSPIRVERIAGSVFVVGGGADALWASGFYVTAVKRRMRARGRRDVTALVYSGAGHEITGVVPRQVAVSAVGYGTAHSRYGTLYLGGSPRADEAALEDSWPKLLAFLGRLSDPR